MVQNDKALDHAWSYFQLHANQRITVFNYFVAFSGVLAAGLLAIIQAHSRFALAGVGLGLLLTWLSFVFWKLDQRTAFLVKHAEAKIKSLEPVNAALFAEEEGLTDAEKQNGLWTYRKAFKAIFITMGVIGLLGAGFSATRWTGKCRCGKASTVTETTKR